MRKYGGFEGNGQTLRILGKLDKYTENNGLNPTRRMLLGVLKYPIKYSELVNPDVYNINTTDDSAPYWLFSAASQKPPKCYHDCDQDIVDFIFAAFDESDVDKFTNSLSSPAKGDDEHKKPKHKASSYKSLDCSIMNLADNISYSLHDLEDAISLRLVDRSGWDAHFQDHQCLFNNLANDLSSPELMFATIADDLFSNQSYKRKGAIGTLVNLMITSSIIEDNGSMCFEELLKYQVSLPLEIEQLRDKIFMFVFENVIKHENVQQLEFKGQKIVIELFQTLANDPIRFLPKVTRERWQKAYNKDLSDHDVESAQYRVICDFVSGMTDEYATKYYDRLLTSGKGSIFDRL
jgi:dGTPase